MRIYMTVLVVLFTVDLILNVYELLKDPTKETYTTSRKVKIQSACCTLLIVLGGLCVL